MNGILLRKVILIMSGVFSLLFKIIYRVSFGELKRKLRLLKHGWSLMVSPDSWLVQTGYVRSVLTNCAVDNAGMPLPWMNYELIGFLKDRLTKELNIFEYGSGNSTLFFSSYVNMITSVEYDSHWYTLIESKIKRLQLSNVKYIYCELGSRYTEIIELQNEVFDLIIIDGRVRVESAIGAFAKLANEGVVLLDDSNRKKYKYIFEFYRSKGFSFLTFSGIKPTGFGCDWSTIFYRQGQNCFGL